MAKHDDLQYETYLTSEHKIDADFIKLIKEAAETPQTLISREEDLQKRIKYLESKAAIKHTESNTDQNTNRLNNISHAKTELRAIRYAERGQRYLHAHTSELIDKSHVEGYFYRKLQQAMNLWKHLKNIANHLSKPPVSPKSDLEHLSAIKQVLKGKLKRLAHDPRPYEKRKAEIIATERELYAVNEKILEEVAQKTAIDEIKNKLTVKLNADNKLVILSDNKDISALIDNRDYIYNTIIAAKLTLDANNATALNSLPIHIQQQILTSLFFIDKRTSIATRIRQLNVTRDANLNSKELELELCQKTMSLNKINAHYFISRLGKVIAGDYALSQGVSLFFLCIVMLTTIVALGAVTAANVALLSGPGFIVVGGLVIIAWWVQATLRNNWWVFRDNAANMLIEFWNMLANPDDIELTPWEKIKLYLMVWPTSVISGFVAGFFTYKMTAIGLKAIFGLGAMSAAGPLLPIIFGTIGVIAGVAIFLIFLKYSRETALSGTIWEDFWQFWDGIYADNQEDIKKLKAEIKANLTQSYQHYYSGEKLTKKIDGTFDNSILGVVLNYNESVAANKCPEASFLYFFKVLLRKPLRLPVSDDDAANYWNYYFRSMAINFRARIMVLVAFVFAPLVICGIIYGQFASLNPLINFIGKIFESTNTHVEGFCRFLCWMAGIAYIPLFVKATVKCGADLTYSVTKSTGGESTTSTKAADASEGEEMQPVVSAWAKADFQQVRLGNSADNGAQTAYGFIDSKRDRDEDEDFADALDDVLASNLDISGLTIATGAATIGSFVTTSMPGARVNFDKKLDVASKKYTIALENFRRPKITVDVAYYQGDNEVKQNIQIYLAYTDNSKITEYKDKINGFVDTLNIKFSNIPASQGKNTEERMWLHIPDDNYTITLQTTSYFKKKIFKGKEEKQPYVDAQKIIEVLEDYEKAKGLNLVDAWVKKWDKDGTGINGVRILPIAQTQAQYQQKYSKN